MSDLGVILSRDGDWWNVMERTRLGHPLRVAASDERLRGSFMEQRLNAALAVDNVTRELRLALPAWVRLWWPEPATFWYESGDSVRSAQ